MDLENGILLKLFLSACKFRNSNFTVIFWNRIFSFIDTIKSIPHLIGILKTDGEYCTKISQEKVNCIQSLLGDGNVVDYLKICFENSQVKVQSGPLKGLEGLIRAVNKRKNRVKIEIQFLGCSKNVDIGIEVVSVLED